MCAGFLPMITGMLKNKQKINTHKHFSVIRNVWDTVLLTFPLFLLESHKNLLTFSLFWMFLLMTWLVKTPPRIVDLEYFCYLLHLRNICTVRSLFLFWGINCATFWHSNYQILLLQTKKKGGKGWENDRAVIYITFPKWPPHGLPTGCSSSSTAPK